MAFNLGRYDLCQECLVDGLAADPNNVDLLDLLSQVHVATGRYESARQLAQSVVSLDPEFPGGFRMLAWATILDAKYSPNDPKFDPVSSDNRVALKSRVKQARELAERCLEIDPEDPYHFSLLAEIEFLSDDAKSALEATQRGLHVDPRHGPCSHQRMRALQELDRLDDAIETGLQRLTIDPDDETCHYQLSRSYLANGNRESATRHARHAVQLDPQKEDHRKLYWDTIKAQNPLFRPFVYWQFFVKRISKLPRFLKVFPVGLVICLFFGLGVAKEHYGESMNGIFMCLLFVFAFLAVALTSERPCMTLVDLIMYATDKQYRIAVDRKGLVANALLMLSCAIVAVCFISNGFGIHWPLGALIASSLLALPLGCVFFTRSMVWKVVMVTATVSLAAFLWYGLSVFNGSVPNTAERNNATYMLAGFLFSCVVSTIIFLIAHEKEIAERLG